MSSAVVPKGSPLRVIQWFGQKGKSHIYKHDLFFIQNVFDENISWLRDTGTIGKMAKDEERSEAIRPLPKMAGDQPLTTLRYSHQDCLTNHLLNCF